MGKVMAGLLSLLVPISLVLVSCAPPSNPATPAPIPTSVQPSSSQPSLVATTPTAEDAAWEKVIADAKKEGTVTAYSFGFIGDVGNAINTAFKKKYGITVEFITGTGSQLIPRIQSESRSGQYVADTLDGSVINSILAKKQGLTQSYGVLPELRNRDIWVVAPNLDKEGHIMALSYIVQPLWVNTKLLNPADAPKSWKALLDPQWKGKIVVTDPDTMPLPGQIYIALTRYMGFSDDYFRELGKQDLVFAPNQRENDAMVARGQYPITLTSAPSSMGSLIAEGASVVPIDMAEGVPSLPSTGINLVSKAPHPNASRLYLNWLLTKEGQDVHGRARLLPSIRKDINDYSPPQSRIKYSRLVPLNQQDLEDSAQAQQDKVLSKMWKKK